MEPCSECLTGGYIFDGTFGYVCNRRFFGLGGVKCENRKRSPQRTQCIIPDTVKSIYPILEVLRLPTERVLYNLVPPENSLAKVVSADEDLATTAGPSVATPTKVASSKQILKCNLFCRLEFWL